MPEPIDPQPTRLTKLADSFEFLRIQDLALGLLKHAPIYVRSGDAFKLFKEAGDELDLAQIEQGGLWSDLHIASEDKERAVIQMQREMVQGRLKDLLHGGDLAPAKQVLSSLLSEALLDPHLRILEGFRGLMQVLVTEMASDSAMLQAFLMVQGESYGLADHGLNVMALVIGLANRLGRNKAEQTDLALTALLHDVGKTQVPENLRFPSWSLSEQEYYEVRRHPEKGVALVRDRTFGLTVLQGIAQHHERLDGSGYPQGIRKVSLAGQVVGLANSYEALTNPLPVRPKRLPPLDTLVLLKGEADRGKFDPALFHAFAYSLTR